MPIVAEQTRTGHLLPEGPRVFECYTVKSKEWRKNSHKHSSTVNWFDRLLWPDDGGGPMDCRWEDPVC